MCPSRMPSSAPVPMLSRTTGIMLTTLITLVIVVQQIGLSHASSGSAITSNGKSPCCSSWPSPCVRIYLLIWSLVVLLFLLTLVWRQLMQKLGPEWERVGYLSWSNISSVSSEDVFLWTSFYVYSMSGVRSPSADRQFVARHRIQCIIRAINKAGDSWVYLFPHRIEGL